MELLVQQIKDLPPQLSEELYGETEVSKKMDMKNEIWGELTDILPCITEEKINNRVLEMQGRTPNPTKYDKNISKELINLAEITAISVGYKLEPIICQPNVNQFRGGRVFPPQMGPMYNAYHNREMLDSEMEYSDSEGEIEGYSE